MCLAYPADLTEEPEGGFTVAFPDVPEAITHGRDRAEALREAEAAQASALSFYADDGQPRPRRSSTAGRPLVRVFSPAVRRLASVGRAGEREAGCSRAALTVR
jgi:antitoxin HicB